ncbi:MAG TPA: PKD domain-containing protein [Flavobacteriales bacterium]|nr:PKD domain-containing protein [Flavobacteriales bacterium]
MHPSRTLILFFIVLGGAAHGQVLSGLTPLKGGGILQTCDTSMHVDFATTYLNNYGCQFSPDVVLGSTSQISAQWDYYNHALGIWSSEYSTAPTVSYAGAQPYPMCYTVNAFDQVASQPCITTVCKLVTPYAYAQCAAMEVDFTIGSVNGNSITFANTSQFPGGQIAESFWDFGDGSSVASSPSATHAFSGSGPFQICLTVVGGAPDYCTATRCQWLYLGPAGLPCDEVVDHGFSVLQYGNLVGALDTSYTTGMNARYDWDFGDGALASGRIAAHAYAPDQTYELCGTLRVWGPLLSDTCVTTLCRTIDAQAVVGTVEQHIISGILAWPNPFENSLFVAPSAFPRQAQLLDAAGRVVAEQTLSPTVAATALPFHGVPPGAYLLLLHGPEGRQAQRIVRAP